MSLTSIGILYPKPLVRTMEMCGSVVKRRGQPNLFLIMYPNSLKLDRTCTVLQIIYLPQYYCADCPIVHWISTMYIIMLTLLGADIVGVCFSVCLPLHPGLHSGQHRDSPHHQRQPGADYGHATPRLHHIQGEG